MPSHLRLSLPEMALADLDTILADPKLNPEKLSAGRWLWKSAYRAAFEQVAQTRNQIIERGSLKLSPTLSVTPRMLDDARTPLVPDGEGNTDIVLNDLMARTLIDTAAYVRCLNGLGGTPVQWKDTTEWAFETAMGMISEKKRTLDLGALSDAEKALADELGESAPKKEAA